jgi:hypothetical protein
VAPRGPNIGQRIGGYLARQHLGLVALVLVVGGGSAYAADRLARNSVTSKHIKNGTVRGVDLGARAVTANKLSKGAVTVTKLRGGAVTMKKIGDGQVTGAKIADGSVSGAKIGDGQVTGAKIADGSVSGAKIGDGQVTGADIADRAIGASDLDPGTVGDVMSAAGSLPSDGTSKEILAVDGFGVLRATCTPPNTLGFFYTLNSPVSQRARAFGHDALDNAPVGSAAITGTAGGVGYGAPNHGLLGGEVWTSTSERVLAIEISIDTGCFYRITATLDRNEAG